jgi:hypothetical protein
VALERLDEDIDVDLAVREDQRVRDQPTPSRHRARLKSVP